MDTILSYENAEGNYDFDGARTLEEKILSYENAEGNYDAVRASYMAEISYHTIMRKKTMT